MYVYGRNVLRELLRSNQPVNLVYFSDSGDKELEELKMKVKDKGFPSTTAPKNVLTRLCGEEKNQGVVIDIGEFQYSDELSFPETPFIVILDQIQDPQNLGAVIRSCAASGADLIVIPKDNSVHVTPGVVKASAGTVFRVPIAITVNIARYIETIKKKGVWVYGADMNGTSIWEADLTRPLAIVLGNEGSGIRPLVKKSCDGIISIPMKNDVESLNVSVSAGIIMFEVLRREYIRQKG